MHNIGQILKAKEFISSKTTHKPTIGLILGSGLGNLADEITDSIVIPYSDTPYFAKSAAIGHANELVIGKFKDKTVIAMKGRFHYYEGYSLDEVSFPVRVMKELGVSHLIITNSCGAVNTDFKPGDLMLISDHINLVGTNPLIGKNNDYLGPRFPDLSNVYDKDLRQLVQNIAKEEHIPIQQGVYAWWSGPTYETPAEIRMIRVLGADAVGMSTVPEAIVATHAGLKVIGISCLTNMACGILDKPLCHDEVIEVANMVKSKFTQLIQSIIRKL
ncbi:purine-nucleoside phosphorylase [Mycoplasmatota bacterium]|nr:purine-nucleoside phosphorylase [Mycoplasmatota bacterium]